MHNTRSKRWPLKADYLPLKRGDMIALVDGFAKINGLECLRTTSEFRHYHTLDPISYDPVAQYRALQFIIDVVNASPHDERMVSLGACLAGHFGELTRPIAVRLGGWPFVIEPALWRQ